MPPSKRGIAFVHAPHQSVELPINAPHQNVESQDQRPRAKALNPKCQFMPPTKTWNPEL
jgi:hypothetical protein